MLPGRLRSRLLIGLLVVTGVGLFVTALVGFLTLRSFITDRLDAQLTLAAERAMVRLDNDTPPAGVDAPSPSPYFVALVEEETGEITQIYGDTEREDVVMDRVTAIPVEELRGYGSSGRIFELSGQDPDVPPHRATVRLRPDSIMVTGVPTNDREQYSQQLVLTQLVTAVLLLTALVLAGRWLIVRGLEPLGRMATTANQISTGSDLSERMPESDPQSEVGRLGQAINTMLGRIERSFAAQRESEERVRAFAADASHELRTPLTTILGYAELYRHGGISEEAMPGAMRRIEVEAGRMSRLVAELLELARLDRSGSLRLERTDLAEVLREVADDARSLRTDTEVTLDVPDHLECEVDEGRVRQVLANLLSNVTEHTPDGTPITLRLRAEDASARIEVADEGPGMSEEDLRRARDRFYRGTRAPGGGSGLGLAIVDAIAVAHGGEVDIGSTLGAGTTVTVRFPLRHDNDEA
ncbi:sensor histidine kinase [Halostreptopolyspora alba]|uniref:histidine kinase n=1 Tax=Halostreptopolyspora alba TaxID=2487137 RepID=A0A3N0E806_9ACTN|nr:sensor histidine kinase [Nocardiopsaceae bacterium YIM 96095]